MPPTSPTPNRAALFTGSTHSLAGRTAEAAIFYHQIDHFVGRSGCIELNDYYPKTAAYLNDIGVLGCLTNPESTLFVANTPLTIDDGRLFVAARFDAPVHHDELDWENSQDADHIFDGRGTKMRYGHFCRAVLETLCSRTIATATWRGILHSSGLKTADIDYFFLQPSQDDDWFQVVSNKDMFDIAGTLKKLNAPRPNWFDPLDYCEIHYPLQTSKPQSKPFDEPADLFDYGPYQRHAERDEKINCDVVARVLKEFLYASQRHVILAALSSDAYKDDLVGTPVISGASANERPENFLKAVNFAFPDLATLVDNRQLSDEDLLILLRKAERFRDWYAKAKLDAEVDILREIQKGLIKDMQIENMGLQSGRWMLFAGTGLAVDAMIGSPFLGTAAGLSVGAYDSLVHDRITSGWRPSMFVGRDFLPVLGKAMDSA